MKDKVSSIQVAMLFALVVSSMYLGLGDIILLDISKNDALISMIIGIILGLVPLLMYLKINDCFPELNIYKKNKKLFGNLVGKLLNFLFVILSFIMIVIAFRSLITFINSKYLSDTPYYLIGLLVLVTSIILSTGKLEKLTRVTQIIFIIAFILIICVELFLSGYIEIDNLLPILTTSKGNILYGALYYASLTSLTSFFFLSINKSKIKDHEKFSKNMIIFYLIATVSLTIVMFYIISCFGYELASIFEYPEYVILKKIIISNSDFHIENILSFRWIFYIISLSNIGIYSIKKWLEESKFTNKTQITIVIIISLLALFLSKNIFPNDPNSIIVFKNYYLIIVAVPIFIILLIIYIRSLFITKRTWQRFFLHVILLYFSAPYFPSKATCIFISYWLVYYN